VFCLLFYSIYLQQHKSTKQNIITLKITSSYQFIKSSVSSVIASTAQSIKNHSLFNYFPKQACLDFQSRCLQLSVVRKLTGAIATALVALQIYQPTSLTAEVAKANADIVSIESIDALPISHPTHTVFFFDIDDTLFDSPHMLGSKAWRKYITQATDQQWHDRFSLFLAQKLPVSAVETTTSEIVKKLQMKGYEVCGLTARERQIWYYTPTKDVDLLTIAQLKAAGIQFDGDAFQRAYPDLTKAKEYFGGIFFANREPKGEYLKALFANTSATSALPKKIVFIDDKLSQVESVAAVLKDFNIDHECYWYYATDKKASRFDPLIANIQLYHLWLSDGREIISDREAEILAQQYPERGANYYLQAVLDDAQHKIGQ